MDPSRGLLAALEDFVKPIVYECMLSDNMLEKLRQGCKLPTESIEHQLLNYLKAFVADTIAICRTTSPHQLSNTDFTINGATSSTAMVPAGCRLPVEDRPQCIPLKFKEFIKRDILTRITGIVFKMPTRLLAFDSTGSQIHLVDHHETVQFLADIIFTDMDTSSPSFLPRLLQLLQLLQVDSTGQIPYDLRTADLSSDNQLDEEINNFIYKHCRYTILSHTWSKSPFGELSFQSWAKRDTNHKGYGKIVEFCKVSAQNHGYRLGWLDTCCINKESSAELDEAIRSMYKWYRKAALCIIYLSDTTSVDAMAQDSWFTRGWTLQELVAPKRIEVYNMDWIKMSLDKQAVYTAAGISLTEMTLFRRELQERIPISRRLQMACGRHVTREEDGAYSLMGLLGVSISVAYGEGAVGAFSRLMRELINTKRHIIDIFNHGYSDNSANVIPSTIEAYHNRSNDFDNDYWGSIPSKLDKSNPIEPFLLTHVGLRIHLLLFPGFHSSYEPNLNHSPKGSFYGRIWDFNLLDSRLYCGGYSHLVGDTKIFGVINFSIDCGYVTIGNPCLSIPLEHLGQQQSYRHTRPTDQISTWVPSVNSPPVFELRRIGDPPGHCYDIVLSEKELDAHGLQLIMLYI